MNDPDPAALAMASDAELLRACQQGSPAAWEQLIRRYQRLIYAIPRRAGLQDDLAAEVFQRVWLTLFEHLDRIEQPERLGAWLATTARRETWRQLRSQRQTASITASIAERSEEDTLLDTLVDPTILPDEALERMERQHTVRRAVAALDERCRHLLTLLFYTMHPPSYATIAQTMGIPQGSVGPTRARCLQRLRQTLERLEGGEPML
ncbi:MAG: RNA polymerase sigma factor [Chloroflexaceae bacterium]